MAQLIVRNIEDDLKARLQRRAARHGHSMEAEMRDILRDAMKQEDAPTVGLGTQIATMFEGIGFNDAEREAIEGAMRGHKVKPAVFED
jgi:plasmid stability protein